VRAKFKIKRMHTAILPAAQVQQQLVEESAVSMQMRINLAKEYVSPHRLVLLCSSRSAVSLLLLSPEVCGLVISGTGAKTYSRFRINNLDLSKFTLIEASSAS
jgi:hypothetical protein